MSPVKENAFTWHCDLDVDVVTHTAASASQGAAQHHGEVQKS